jgi:hypothetical protein
VTQQVPVPPPTYVAPAQNSYFPPQHSPSPAQTPQQPPQFTQPQPAHNQYGGQDQGQAIANPQVQYQHEAGNASIPVIPPAQNVSPVSPEAHHVAPFPPDVHNQGQSWALIGQENVSQSPGPPQNTVPFSQTPPPQGFPTPIVPPNTTGQPPQWTQSQTPGPMSPDIQHQTVSIHSPQFTPDQVSPPLIPQSGVYPGTVPAHVDSNPISPQAPSSAPQRTEFIAELPADLGAAPPAVNASAKPGKPQPQQYQAYNQNVQDAQAQSRPQSFIVPRRAISTSSASTLISKGPWRIADPSTEQPTPEFFAIADLLFDGLDRNCEPKNTGKSIHSARVFMFFDLLP